MDRLFVGRSEIPNFCHHNGCKNIAIDNFDFCYIHCCRLCRGDIKYVFGICQKCIKSYYVNILMTSKRCASLTSKFRRCQNIVKNGSAFCVEHSCKCGWEKLSGDVYCGGYGCTHKGVYL
jgi:hypothetical protein